MLGCRRGDSPQGDLCAWRSQSGPNVFIDLLSTNTSSYKTSSLQSFTAIDTSTHETVRLLVSQRRVTFVDFTSPTVYDIQEPPFTKESDVCSSPPDNLIIQTTDIQTTHSNMKQGLVILVLFLTLGPGCAYLGWWLSKKWLQAQLDEYDRAALAAEVVNARAAAVGANGAAVPAVNGAAAPANGAV